MRFEYSFNERGQLFVNDLGVISVHVECYYDTDTFLIEKAEGYVRGLDAWIDCTEEFKKRTTMVQAVLDRAAEDYSDSMLSMADTMEEEEA